MRILVLNYEFPPLGGGAGNVTKTIALALVRRGHQVRILTAGMSHLPQYEVLDGVEIFRCPTFRQKEDTCTVPEMAAYLASAFLPGWRMIRHWKPEVLHVHQAVPTGFLAWPLHLLTRVPYVLTTHLGDVPGGMPEETDHLFRKVNWLARPLWKMSADVTGVSQHVAELGRAAYGREVTVIPNGVEMSGGRPPAKPVGSPVNLVFAGRLTLQKNLSYLLDRLAALPDLPWRLTIIGDGPERGNWTAQARKPGLAERVHFTGWMSPLEVSRALAAADILCMPSRVEGHSVAALEGLRAGLAIVATDGPGFTGIVEDGVNGWRIPLADHRLFEERLRSLISDPALIMRFKEASWRKAEDFSIDALAAKYEAVLEAAAR